MSALHTGPKPYSLRLKLLKLISIPLLVAAIIVGGVSLLFIYHEIDEVYDAELSSATKVLYQLTAHEIQEHEEESKFEISTGPQEVSHHYEKNIVFSVWKGDHLVTQSPGSDFPESFHPQPGFSTQVIRGESWRFFVYVDTAQNITIQAAEKIEIRTELIFQILGSTLLPSMFFLPLIFILIWLGTTWSLKPVISLSHAVDRRDAADLTPITSEQVPQEIMSLVRALNRLLGRVNLSLNQERAFTDNAAHELRTPLAAMKTQTQVLIKQGDFNERDRAGLENLLASVNRGTHMVDQLLSFARLQSQDHTFEMLDLSALVEKVMQDMRGHAAEKNQIVHAHIDRHVILNGNEPALNILMRNILENAIKFTPQNGQIDIRLTAADGHIVLQVSDNGPGIADQYKTSVFERFFRLDKSRAQGSGLGLSMVKWIAEMHKSQITLADNLPTGLVVTLTFPKIAE